MSVTKHCCNRRQIKVDFGDFQPKTLFLPPIFKAIVAWPIRQLNKRIGRNEELLFDWLID